MSAIQKKPYIRNVLDSMEDEEKVTLLQLVDGKQNKPTPKSLINPSQHITGADKLLTPEYIALETKDGVHTGYLIYNDDYCTLVAYEDGSQGLRVMDIDLSTMTYSVNREDLTITDLRFEIEESKEKMDVVDYIKEALEEGQIVVDGGALVVSLSNVNLSTGTASAALSSDDFAIAADEDKPCVLQMGLSTQSVWPVGDLVELNRISVVANTSATFAGVVNGCVINAVFTSGAGTVTIKNDGARIVEITGQEIGPEITDTARQKQIMEADVLLYLEDYYYKIKVTSGSVFFSRTKLNSAVEAQTDTLTYIKSSNTISSSTTILTCTRRSDIGTTFSTSVNYVVGDLVWRNGILYRCTTAHNAAAWDATHFTATDVSNAIKASVASVGGDIVTISATGVQSDEMAAKIENAKALVYNNRLYTLHENNSVVMDFRHQYQGENNDSARTIEYTKSTKIIAEYTYSYGRVSSIDGKRSGVSVDSSLQTTGSTTSATLGLTGKLPYLTSLPGSDNTSGFMTIVVVSSEPAAADRKAGYLYIVTGA